MLKNHLLIALRTLKRNASISAVNVLGLSVGMTAAILIFLWVDNELTFDSYHPDANHIYRLNTLYTNSKWVWPSTTYLLGQHLDLPAVTTVACFQPAYQSIIHFGNDLIEEKKGAFVDNTWFSIFHYDFIAGSPADFLHNPSGLILTASKAKKYFGDKDPIGQTLRIDSMPYKVAGIIRDNPANSSFQFDILRPIDALLADPNRRKNSLEWNNYNFQIFVKLQPAANPAVIGRAVTGILQKNNPPSGGNTIRLTSLKDIHFENDLTIDDELPHSNSKTVYIFSVLGVFLLVIACINYVNLTTARASQRAKEVGIRKLVGAGKTSLFGQFFLESLTISLLSLALTLLFVTLAMPPFRELSGATIQHPFSNPETWKIIAITLLAATLLNGVYPALLLSSFKPLNVLKGAITLKFKDITLRKGLVVLQFTFSIVLIASAIIIQRQLQYIQHTSPGYDRSQTFTFRLPWPIMAGKTEAQISTTSASVKQQLLTHPAITGVSFASESIVELKNSNEGSANWDGKAPDFVPVIAQFSADESFKTSTSLEMQQGRWFDPLQPTDRHNFILNETAIGRFNIRPLVILNRPSWRSVVYVRTAQGKTSEALTAARTVWSQMAPNQPFDYNFLDETFDHLYKADTRTSSLILIFSALAILISCLGLLGLAAFTARQRVKEIGIRKVLGATVTNILTLLSRDFLRLVIVSVLIATPIAWWAMHSWLEDFAYHIPLRPWTFLVAGLLAIGIALLTIASQSLRAARANPVKNLRMD
jgi:putative ABC transport system permease protein